MKKSMILLAGIFFISACAATGPLTDDEKAYLASISSESNRIVISKDNIADAWGRANSYVVKNSSMKIQTANDYLIDTYNPSALSSSDYSTYYGYRVTKTPVDGGYEVEIVCLRAGTFTGLQKNLCPQNEKIFSNYLRTGQLPYPGLIAK